MVTDDRFIAIVGRLGIRPMVRLSLPARRLLAYLALRGGEVARQHAADELWPDHPEEVGRANLRRSLWQTPPDWIEGVGDTLILAAECDLPAARRTASRAIHGDALTFDEIDLLSLDLLPGWHEEWAIAAHEDFRLLRIQALEAACSILSGRGNHALAIQAGAAAVAAEPLRESAAEALIEAHLAQHNRFEAVQCFRALEGRLRDELGVLPGADLVERITSFVRPRNVA